MLVLVELVAAIAEQNKEERIQAFYQHMEEVLMPKIEALKDESLRHGHYANLQGDVELVVTQFLTEYRQKTGVWLKKNTEQRIRKAIADDLQKFIDTGLAEERLLKVIQAIDEIKSATITDLSTVESQLVKLESLEGDLATLIGSRAKAREHIAQNKENLVSMLLIDLSSSNIQLARKVHERCRQYISAEKAFELHMMLTSLEVQQNTKAGGYYGENGIHYSPKEGISLTH